MERDKLLKKQPNQPSSILKKLMLKYNISDMQLSNKLNIPNSVIHQILNKDDMSPRLGTLEKIADYFGISVSNIIGEIPLDTAYELSFSNLRKKNRTSHSWSFELYKEATNVANEFIAKNMHYSMDAEQAIMIINEIYFYSLKKNLNKIDNDFAQWYLGFILDKLSD